MTVINPDEFIITRKRKKYRFALFANSPLCFELDKWDRRQPVDCVEVGAGTGLFCVELAALSPASQFVAVDVKADRLQKGAREAQARGLGNIRFLRARADQLSDCFNAASLKQLWLTFPDPYPKSRSAKHRLTHPSYLSIYARLLQHEGKLCFKTDDHTLFDWSIEQLVGEHWQLDELSFDLHESPLPDAYKIMTTYERRWRLEGKLTYFVSARYAPGRSATCRRR